MEIVKDWTTSELMEFLNSYNRVFKTNPSKAIVHQALYVEVFVELSKRMPLLALLY